jgi:predicted glycosyltransferase
MQISSYDFDDDIRKEIKLNGWIMHNTKIVLRPKQPHGAIYVGHNIYIFFETIIRALFDDYSRVTIL